MPKTQKKKGTHPAKTSAERPGLPKEGAKALAQVQAEIEALRPEDLESINLDIPRAVAVALAAANHLSKLRPRVVEHLPLFPVRLLDGLATYALAAWYAHLLALPTVSEQDVAVLVEEATPLREDMLVAAEALAHKGYFDVQSVKAIREGQGNIDKANDLVALAALFTAGWERVQNKTTVEWDEVQRAAELGPRLLLALGARELPGVQQPDVGDPAQRRVRTYTLFVRAYEECRRAVHYLRWHEDDADDIAPSLHATRGRRASGAPATEQPSSPEGGAAPQPPPA